MTDRGALHRSLERRLFRVRSLHGGRESPAEERLLAEMENLWWQMTQEERDRLNARARGRGDAARDSPPLQNCPSS
jgi:hypothetical protein